MELINNTPFQYANIVGRINFPQHSLTLIVKGTFDLKLNEKAVVADEQLFATGDEFYPEDQEQTGSIKYESDFAYYKAAADLLLSGKCHAPQGEAVTQCDVSFQVGERRRLLRVFGNRYWQHTIGSGAISEPTRFLEMPIIYENAFGGEGFHNNPIGKGALKGKLLPNVEDVNNLIDSPDDQPEPAGFSAVNRTWEARASKLGTYKGDYLKKRWPWFPEDFDWSHYNAAPAAMQVPGYLKGDEKLSFENLHRTCLLYQCQLPGLRLRGFTRAIDPESKKPMFQEVDMNLDTLWVDTEAEKLVLVWRGWTEVATEDYEEISHVFLMSEPLGEVPVSVEEAHQLFADKRQEIEKEFSAAPESPAEIKLEVEDAVVHESTKDAAEMALEEAVVTEPSIDAKVLETQVNSVLSQMGIDVDKLPAVAKQQMQQQQTKFITKLTETDPAKLAEIESDELKQQLKAELAKLDIDLDNLPPVSEKAKQEQQRFMQELGFEDEEAIGSEEVSQLWEVTSALLPKMRLDPEDLTPLIAEAKKQKEKIDKQLGIEPQSEEEKEVIKKAAELKAEKIEQIKSRAQKGESFAGEDFSGLDLSGLDLHNLDFTGALFIGAKLEKTNLSAATLNRAKFTRANLRKAILNKAQMEQVDFTYADLSGAECKAAKAAVSIFSNTTIVGADLSESDFSFVNFFGSDLSESKFEDTVLSGANVTKAKLNKCHCFGADLSDAVFEGSEIKDANFDQVMAKDTIFSTADVSGSRFVEAKMAGADFSGGTLNKSNFQGADLSEASLEKATAQGVDLSHANLSLLRASEGSDFSNANLEQAQGKESIWHDANLSGADFKFANMEGADFSKASLVNANCYGSDMRFARFIRTNLSGAQMLDMNLFKGSVERANLTGTLLSGSNLYGVEFLGAHLEKTQLHGANVKATKLQEVV
ncbi:DUF2169 domain-containing protein [Kaarinaea lacus]